MTSFLTQYAMFLIDASGVLYDDNGPVPGAVEAIRFLQRLQLVLKKKACSCWIPHI